VIFPLNCKCLNFCQNHKLRINVTSNAITITETFQFEQISNSHQNTPPFIFTHPMLHSCHSISHLAAAVNLNPPDTQFAAFAVAIHDHVAHFAARKCRVSPHPWIGASLSCIRFLHGTTQISYLPNFYFWVVNFILFYFLFHSQINETQILCFFFWFCRFLVHYSLWL